MTNVYNQYQKSIEFGFESDWETAIAEMNSAMMAAGLQDIIDENKNSWTAGSHSSNNFYAILFTSDKAVRNRLSAFRAGFAL